MIKFIIKRSGEVEPFTAKKINDWGRWASDAKVDWSSVVMETCSLLPETVSSVALQEALIAKCIEQETWGYMLMAGRLYAPQLLKSTYPEGIPTIIDLHERLIDLNLMVDLGYSHEEYDQLQAVINHNLDYGTPHFSLKYIREKYSIQNRQTNTFYETQQFTYMRMAMAIASNEPVDVRVERAISFYNSFSQKKVSAPTPNFVNLGTPLKGFASCCLYAAGDTVNSIGIGDWIGYRMTASSAGIGNNYMTRSLGESVRSGALTHNGKLPYFKAMAGAVKANMQAGRGGACTTYYSAYDPEAEVISQLRNPRSPEGKRNRDLHYALMTNKFFANKVARNEDAFVFNVKSAPDLHKAFYSADGDKFAELYQKYEDDVNFKKEYFSPRKLIVRSMNEAFETGVAYLAMMDEMNRHTPFKEPIYSSNLCVAPETMLLTDRGHFPIASRVNEEVNIWNGEEYSTVTVRQTGENQPLLKVKLSDGRELDCTEYHKWYVQNEYHKSAVETRTVDLKLGDKLIKLNTPVIEGTYNLEYAYANGFYTGDGTYLGNNIGRIYLYNEKRTLKERIGIEGTWRSRDNRDHIETHLLYPKYFVPGPLFTVQSRLDWLAGILDSDGSIYRNGETESISLTSNNLVFIKDVQDMLQTLSINTKVLKGQNAGYNSLPLNDGTGNYGKFYCKETYRIVISAADSQILLSLGLTLSRLDIKVRKVQRAADAFAKVIAIVDEGRIDDTYCVTEPKRHMAVFNGILTGQCLEIAEPTAPYYSMTDLYSDTSVGWVKFTANKGGKETKLMYGWNDKIKLLRDGIWHTTYAGQLAAGDVLGYVEGDYDDLQKAEVLNIIGKKEEPEVAMCSLGAINVAEVELDADYEEAMYTGLKMIDYCIYNTEHELPHVGYTSVQRMNAGMGIMGLATLMARYQLDYDSVEGKKFLHRVAERHMYFAIKASIRISKERGLAPWIHKTKWVDGWTPMQTYNKNVDTLGDFTLEYDWDELSKEIRENGGIGHSCLVAYMPGESSSKALGQANSIYPIRELTMVKTDNKTTVDWVANESDNPHYKYQSAWKIDPDDQVDMYAIFQKFTDQGISGDMWMEVLEDEKVGSTVMIRQYLRMVKYGMKSRYYLNSQTSNYEGLVATQNINDGSACGTGGCTI